MSETVRKNSPQWLTLMITYATSVTWSMYAHVPVCISGAWATARCLKTACMCF